MLRFSIAAFLVIALCAFSVDAPDKCIKPLDHLFSIKDLRSGLVGGEWQYQYSYFQDTCFTVDNLISVPKLLRFREDADSVKHNKTRHEQNLPNMICTHKDNISGAMIETFPGWGGNFDRDTLRESFPISQIPAGNARGMKFEVCYRVLSILRDTMVVQTGYMIELRGKKEWDISHVFYRKPLR